ncbi:hypothetical protein GQ457_02G011510 [Hibiscus cannabinus]
MLVLIEIEGRESGIQRVLNLSTLDHRPTPISTTVVPCSSLPAQIELPGHRDHNPVSNLLNLVIVRRGNREEASSKPTPLILVVPVISAIGGRCRWRHRD